MDNNIIFINSLISLFAPLTQFDIFTTYNNTNWLFKYFVKWDEVNVLFTVVTVFLTIWYVVDYYNSEQVDSFDMLYFDHETLMISIIDSNNSNYSAFVLTLFGTIFMFNITGLLPYSQTITAQFFFTLFLALTTMLTIWGHGFIANKIYMFNHFLPAGSPLVIIPFIILIEFISNFSRVISLSVRLFANMTSGHALLKILAGFTFVSFELIGIWKLLAVFPTLIIFIITGLELLIAFLQAYVFITLVLIYISELE